MLLPPKEITVETMKGNLTALKTCLAAETDVVAAFLFGSAAKGEPVVNDLDILVLLDSDVDRNAAYFHLADRLSQALGVSENRIDLLFFTMEEADPKVLYNALTEGVLLKNSSPDKLGNSIDALSRYFLENEPMIARAKRLRKERLETFCAD